MDWQSGALDNLIRAQHFAIENPERYFDKKRHPDRDIDYSRRNKALAWGADCLPVSIHDPCAAFYTFGGFIHITSTHGGRCRGVALKLLASALGFDTLHEAERSHLCTLDSIIFAIDEIVNESDTSPIVKINLGSSQ